MANPSGSIIKNNIIFDKSANIGNIDKSVKEFSNIGQNHGYYLFQIKKAFKNHQKGDYSISKNSIIYKYIPTFDGQLLQKVGRF